MDRRSFCRWVPAFAAPALGGALRTAHAQSSFPDRTIRVVVPYPAGGIVDVVIRAATDRMSSTLPQRVIVDNRPGADGRIGLEAVARAPADGYTLIAATPIIVVNESLQHDATFHASDFVGIGAIAAPPATYVVPANSPVATLREFVEYARARPGQLNVANPGSGSSIHLAQELLFESTGIRLTNVGYKGQPPSITDLVQGQIQFALISQSLILPHIKAGRVKALASNAATRTRSLPEVPTISEAGFPAALVQSWYGLAAPARTPAAVVALLSAELQKAMASAETRTRLEGMDAEIMDLDARKFDALMRAELERWGKLIRARGIRAA